MSYQARLYAVANSLRGMFDQVASNAMFDAYQRARATGSKPQEPDFVASLVKLGVSEIKKTLDLIYHGTGVQITTTGVFCHQSPMVRFQHTGNSFRCELGDILIVHTHKDQAQCVQRNALLLQAKMTPPGADELCIPSGEQHQLALYQHWPRFTYDGGILGGQSRSVTPACRHAGAQYLLIDSDRQFSRPVPSRYHYPMAVWMAETPLYPMRSFGGVLVDFLLMNTGRSFSDKGIANGWSEVVWDLLENGLKKGFTRRRSGHQSIPGGRHTGDEVIAYMSAGLTSTSIVSEILGERVNGLRQRKNDDGSIPPELFRELDIGNPESGMSVIVVETDESELRSQFEE